MAALALVLLTLATAPARPGAELWLKASLDVPVVDLAFLGERRLAALADELVSLYAIEGTRLVRTARLALPGEPVRSRASAGLLRLVPGEEACWAITTRRAGATLLTWSGGQLAAVGGAEAIPPTALPTGAPPAGARFETGSNRVLVGPTSVLRLAPGGVAVAPDGTLVLDGQPDPAGRRVGDALAVLGPGVVAISSAAPPATSDEVRILALADPSAPPLASWPVAGRVRALAAWIGGSPRMLAVASDAPTGPEIAVYALVGDLP